MYRKTNNILSLILDYQKTISIGVEQLQSHFKTNQPLKCWKNNLIPQEGTFESGVHYYFHGIGCVFTINHLDVDVDFGPNDRYDGFDLWRLQCFAEEKNTVFTEYSENLLLLERDFYLLSKNKTIVKPNWSPSPHLYYFTHSL